ncbi:hypothetical protein BDZ45DRAFT_432598 [Acephala macrosclerotiorum]|nr:hypothetical protein BDZ45DRAFT_432598 [Acephala macrosclerotiorum]
MAASQVSQKLPAGLAGVLNKPDDHHARDSAYYSAKDPASKHNSTQSSNGTAGIDSCLSRTDSSSAADMTPSPISTGPNTQPLNSPASGAMSVASIVSPTSNGFSHPFYETNNHNGAYDSRRESVDSRLGANFGDMKLANSPYASANPSTTSLQSTLAQQRNPGSAHPDRNSGPFRLSSGYQPNYQRVPDPVSRTAPLITGPALGAIARAPEPTKGQAWAFPEEEVQRLPSAARPSDDASRHGTSFYDDSRRNSYADSIASSQYTTESRLPPGQRRLEDGVPSDYHRGSSEYQVSTHHHSLQHRQIADLQNGEGDSPTSSQPYSRTPELRVSHKLAERKRRLEMKDLFDTLRTLQSVERGAKASKWEILSKAISEHERQTKIIDDQKKQIQRLEAHLHRAEQDLDIARREANGARLENAQLRSEVSGLQGGAPAYHGTAPPVQHHQGYAMQPSEPQQQLPPLRNIPGPEVMNGVQYQHEQRPNGYRPTDRF